jgi:hypothetical protein
MFSVGRRGHGVELHPQPRALGLADDLAAKHEQDRDARGIDAEDRLDSSRVTKIPM